jgi:integrase
MILTFTEALLQRLTATDRRILRDKLVCGFCLQMNKRSKTFLVATSVQGKQLRMMLGRWPLLSVEEARGMAISALKECRAGRPPATVKPRKLPTLMELLPEYCGAKKLKPASLKRYNSIIRTHFAPWKDQPVSMLTGAAFSQYCQQFAQNTGAALVEVGRGVIGALIRYVNAVYGLTLESPFNKLAAAGLMPERSKPRARVLREDQLPAWRVAVDLIGEKQRDYLLLLLYTGLRRDEGINLTVGAVDFVGGVIAIPDTKNCKPHSLPITPLMDEILRRRCNGLGDADRLFKGVSKEHVFAMAIRQGAPKFMLHDLRKLVATTGERLKLTDSTLRRILNHTAPKSDVLHSTYVSLNATDVLPALVMIQTELSNMMKKQSASIGN